MKIARKNKIGARFETKTQRSHTNFLTDRVKMLDKLSVMRYFYKNTVCDTVMCSI